MREERLKNENIVRLSTLMSGEVFLVDNKSFIVTDDEPEAGCQHCVHLLTGHNEWISNTILVEHHPHAKVVY